MIENQINKILDSLKSKIIKKPKYKDIYIEALTDMMLEFANNESLPLELTKVLIEFCELVIGVIDPMRSNFPDLNRKRTENE